MKMRQLMTQAVVVGLSVFAMLLGIPNLIFPLKLGVESGGSVMTCFGGFSLTGVLLPVLGLLAIVLFDGDYNVFFGRLGNVTGRFFIFVCMMIMGPLIVMPRTIALVHLLLQPIMPNISIALFSTLFVFVVFLCAYRPDRVLDLLGKVLSPLKIFSLLIIVIPGLWTAQPASSCAPNAWQFFLESLLDGYQTLDLIGAIFFGSVIVRLLTKYVVKNGLRSDDSRVLKIAAYGGLIGGVLIALVYLSMIYLGAFHDQGLCGVGVGETFRHVVLGILGGKGVYIIGLTAFIVGLGTIIALTTLLGGYVQDVSRKRISYVSATAGVLAVCVLVATMGLGGILEYSRPLVNFLYPLIIVTTVCNLLYKWRGFTWIKLPVLMMALIQAWLIFW